MGRIPVRSFAILLVVLVAGTLAAETLLIRTGRGDLTLGVLVAAGILGLVGVVALERSEPAPAPPVPTPTPVPDDANPEDTEPFDDPVEAADREETEAAQSAPRPGDEPDDGLE